MLPKAITKPQADMFYFKGKVAKGKGQRKKKNTPANQKKGALAMLRRGMGGKSK